MDKYINFNNKIYKMEFSNHHAGTRKFLAKLSIFEVEPAGVGGMYLWNIYGTPSFYAYFGSTVATRKKCDYYINILENKINDEIFKKILSMIDFSKCKGGYRYNITDILINALESKNEVPLNV